MASPEYLAYLNAKETLKDLIAGQAIKLPSQTGQFSDPGETDAKYIKDLVTVLAEFYKSIPNA